MGAVGLVYVDILTRRVEVVASTTEDGAPIRFADDATISSEGQVYFSDATTVAPWIGSNGMYDPIQASLVDVASGSGFGRLLVYDPQDRSTRTLLSGLHFANGVTLSKDEDYILVMETFRFRVMRYWLKGDKAGTSEPFIENLPGCGDGISLASDGSYWVTINAEVRVVKKANLLLL